MTVSASGPLVDRLRAPEWPGIVPAMSTMHEAADTIERLERQALPYSDSLNKYHAAIRELLTLLDDRAAEHNRRRDMLRTQRDIIARWPANVSISSAVAALDVVLEGWE